MAFDPSDPRTWPAAPSPPAPAPPPSTSGGDAFEVALALALAGGGAYAGWRALGGRGAPAVVGALVGGAMGWTAAALVAISRWRL